MKWVTVLAFLISLNLKAQSESAKSVSMCSSSSKNICIELQFENAAKKNTEFRFKIHFNKKINIEDLVVKTTMSMEGGMHHNGPPPQITSLSENDFLVDDLWFAMPGDWTLQIMDKKERGEKHQFMFIYNIQVGE